MLSARSSRTVEVWHLIAVRFNTLKNLVAEADLILKTTPPLPQNRAAAARENLKAALALTEDLLKAPRVSAAAVLGHKGGSTTARKLGADHYKRMAAARKTHAGGRPLKEV